MSNDDEHDLTVAFWLRTVDSAKVLQFWIPREPHGPDFDNADAMMEWLRPRLRPNNSWKVYMGSLAEDGYTTPQLTIAIHKPARMTHSRCVEFIGPIIARGTLDEVWPVFEAYARML